MIERKIYKLKNRIQHYNWGTRNDEAFIPRLLNEEPVEGKPYAELWIGAHPGAPSDIIIGQRAYPLDKIIAEYSEEILGKSSIMKFGKRLPFLLKVLSAGKALSIQLHPDKKKAEWLHSRYPENYPDDNHKPEIAIVLDELTALCGFLPPGEIQQNIRKYPEIGEYVGAGLYDRLANISTDNCEGVLKAVFPVLMKNASEEKRLKKVIDSLVEKISSMTSLNETEKLFLEQQKFYPCDAGLLTFFFFNLLHMRKGQALFIKAGVPHAYIKGNIVECMANSDNVIRAGLTPKFRDVDTMLEVIDYSCGSVDLMNEEQKEGEVFYGNKAGEFEITRFAITAGDSRKINTTRNVNVMMVIKGAVRVDWNGISGPDYLVFASGESFICPALLEEYRITPVENSEFYYCTIGRA